MQENFNTQETIKHKIEKNNNLTQSTKKDKSNFILLISNIFKMKRKLFSFPKNNEKKINPKNKNILEQE